MVYMCAFLIIRCTYTNVYTRGYAFDDVTVLSAVFYNVTAGPHSMVPPQSQPPFNQETAIPFAGSYPSSSTMMDSNSSSELWCWCTLLLSLTHVHNSAHLLTPIFIFVCIYVHIYLHTFIRIIISMIFIQRTLKMHYNILYNKIYYNAYLMYVRIYV